MSDLMLDVDQAGELKAAFRRGDWTNAEIKRLCEGNSRLALSPRQQCLRFGNEAGQPAPNRPSLRREDICDLHEMSNRPRTTILQNVYS